MPPIIVHQANEYSQDLHYNLTLDWIVHHTPYDYIDRDGWIKAMTQLSNICGASPVNNQILLFDGHGSHFKYGALRQMMCKNIQPFVLKPGDSIYDQTNDNLPNYKPKSLYNLAKSAWILKYETKKFSLHHINYVLVEAWDDFKVSVGNIIGYRFSKTMVPPLSPTDLTPNTQACAASIQLSSGANNE